MEGWILMFEVSTGVVTKALKVVIYGPEGIGKSSLASQFPKPIFIDTEGSTDHMENVHRLKRPSSYTELIQMIDWIKNSRQYATLVIDTADWAQALVEKHVMIENNWQSIEAPGYGEGYVKAREKWGSMIDKLSDVVDSGINVVLTAHAEIRKFDDPTEAGSYDRYELKLTKRSNAHIAGVTKEWADMVLFLNYEVMSVKREGMGDKYQAQGGQRKMFTQHHPAYDAKNRFGLPHSLPLDYAGIAHLIPDLITNQQTQVQASSFTQQAPDMTVPPMPVETQAPAQVPPTPVNESMSATQPTRDDFKQALGKVEVDVPFTMGPEDDISDYLPKELADLMRSSGVSTDEIIGVMGVRGHYPINTDLQVIASTQPDYFTGGLAANWEMVMGVVQGIRQDPSQLVELFQKVGEPDPQAKVDSMTINK